MTLPRGSTLDDSIAGRPVAAVGAGHAASARAGRRERRPVRAAMSGLMMSGLMVSGLMVSGLVLAACGDDTATADGDQGVEVSGAWARTSPLMATAGAAYMDLTSADGDRLIAAVVGSEIADTAEIHQTVAVTDDGAPDDGAMGDGAPDDGAMEQAMTMRELDSGLELPAGETVGLAPGGYHIMMIDLAGPLEAGSTFDLVLTFEQAGEQTVTVEVRNEAP